MRILAGDIGGTSSRLALYSVEYQTLRLQARQTYPSQDFPSLEPILGDFVRQAGAVQVAALGVAGPVRDNASRATNLPWLIEGEALQAALGLPHVFLLNDLEAAAWGIDDVSAEQRVVVNGGEALVGGNQSVIAAGTGLGEAGRVWDGVRYRAFASEGAHADFAPADALGWQLLRWLQQRHGHVSWERVVSGPGLVALHAFLREHEDVAIPHALASAMAAGDAAAAIAEAALKGSDAVCRRALEVFVRYFGAEAGNHALKLMATGGVFITGGIAPKLVSALQEGAFLEAFFAKGRMAPLVRAMPVTLITDGDVALAGAARYGELALQGALR